MTIQLVPGKGELKRYLNAGMTQAQIVEAWYEESGERVSRSAIGMAISRYGLKSTKPRAEYKDTLPWVLPEEHRWHTDARMLRLEGRRRHGKRLNEAEARRLEAWKAELERKDAVVYYDRDTEEGFFWVPRSDAGDDTVDPNDDPAERPAG